MPNTTATTTAQIEIPGMEAKVASVVTPIIATTNTKISNLSTSINTQLLEVTKKLGRPNTSISATETSPFPTFAYWSNDNNNKAGYMIINSEFQTVGTSDMPNQLNGYTAMSLDNMNNWYEDFRSYTYTQGNIGSGSVTTYFGGSTVWGGADGHYLYRFPVNGNFAGTFMNRADQRGQFLNRCGTVISNRGVRQRISLYSTDSELQLRPRGATYGYCDRIDLNSATYANWAGRTNRGMASYNERTGMLAVVESNTSNQIRLHVWRNTSYNLNAFAIKPGTLHNYLSEAKTAGPNVGGPLASAKNYSFYDFTWSQTGSTRAEPSYHMRIIMGDNGVVGICRYNHDGYSQNYAYWTPTAYGSAGNAGTGALTDSNVNLGNTTSYGIDQSESWYGQRHEITWDNAWIAAYSPYYYYGCGINCHIINTYDPTKLFYFRNTNTSHGNAIVPFKEDKFLTTVSENNADGPGIYLYLVDPGSANTNFRRQNNTTLSYGGDLQPYNSTYYYQFDSSGSTTQYPHLVNMPHWANP